MSTVVSQARYRPELDGLRGIAILGVLTYHLDHAWLPRGYLGVDVFFVISGFLITQLILRGCAAGDFRLIPFLWRRARRLFPAYVLVIVLSIIAGATLLPVVEMNALGEDALRALFHVFNLDPRRENYFFAQDRVVPLLHLWSLNLEEQVYLFLALLLPAVLRRGWPLLRLLALLGVLSFTIAIAYTLGHVETIRSWAFFRPEARLFEFVLGAWLALSPSAPGRVPHRLAEIGGLVLIALTFAGWLNWPRPFNVLPVLVGAMMVVRSDAGGGLLSFAPLVALGRVSYSLYLVHWPLLVFARFYANDVAQPLGPGTLVLLGLLSLVLAVLLHWTVEQRFRVMGRRENRSTASAARFMVGTAALALVAGIWAAGESGVSPRIKPPVGIDRASTGFDQQNACPLGPCESPDPSAPLRVLAIGDSVLLRLRAPFTDLEAEGIRVAIATELSCPPLFDTPIVARGKLDSRCMQANDAWKARIAAKRPDVVVLLGSWARFVEDGSNVYPTSKLTLGAKPGLRGARNLLEERLKHTVAEVNRLGAVVIVLSPPPTFPVTPSHCYLTPRIWFTENDQLERCAPNADPRVYQTHRFLRESAKRATRDNTRAFQLSLGDFFCDDERRQCRPFDDAQRVAFFDEFHFNDFGMAYATERMRRRFWELLRLGGVELTVPVEDSDVPDARAGAPRTRTAPMDLDPPRRRTDPAEAAHR